MKKFLKWFLVLLAITLCGLTIYVYSWVRQYQALSEDEPEVALTPDVAGLTYCSPDGNPLKMDLYLPKNTPAPYQILVYAHGGSFTSGDKRKGSGVIDIPAMTTRGFAVAAINYRLMPENPFPAEIIDAKCAICFLRAHAAEYQLNTEKIGIWGGSAGGHLVAMVGLTNGDPVFEAGEYLEQSSRVDAVVEMFGPTNLVADFNWFHRWLLRRAFGTDDPSNDLLHRASPVYNVTSAAPPFLILHGERDGAVPVTQAQELHQEFINAGATSTLVIVKNANHNFKPTGGAIQPTREEISTLMANFFDQWLK